jgi:Protein of unknown function (DUF1579)
MADVNDALAANRDAVLDLVAAHGEVGGDLAATLRTLRRIHEMSTRSSVAAMLICGFTSLLLAQAPPPPPKPSPEHKKLEYFVGKWTVESEIKANKFVPAGKTVGTETATLGPGGFYVESRAEGQLGTRLAIIAYDSHAKVYTSYYASSVGLVGTGTGTVNGNTWTWMVEDKYAGKSVKGRTTVTTLSPTQYTSKYEVADEKGGYTTILEGKATKDER